MSDHMDLTEWERAALATDGKPLPPGEIWFPFTLFRRVMCPNGRFTEFGLKARAALAEMGEGR